MPHDHSVAALSGDEWILFTAALAAAVMGLSRAELRVLLVEAKEADEQPTVVGLLRAIEAVGDEITHAIVVRQRAVAAKGWSVIETEQKGARAA